MALEHLPRKRCWREYMFMQTSTSLALAIQRLAEGRFERESLEEFLATFYSLSDNKEIIDSILQISTDEGEELEIGFFTVDTIADITLSNGKVYSYAYPLAAVRELDLSDRGSKWVLTITGEKKIDYNVVKPAVIDDLQKYETNLRRMLRALSDLKGAV